MRLIRPHELVGVVLPVHAARIVVTSQSTTNIRLGHYPLDRFALRLLALCRADLGPLTLARRLKVAAHAAHELRARLKQTLWNSPAAALIGRRTYRRFRARHVGEFAGVPEREAAPVVNFISQAVDVSIEQLAACAASLQAQTDPQFCWIVAIPAERIEREGPALLSALPGRAEILVTQEADTASCMAKALAAADGLVAPLDARGRLTRDAVAMVRSVFAEHPHCAFLYTDEEYCDANGAPLDAAFKPAFNRHLLQAMNYVGSLMVVPAAAAKITGLRSACDSAALYDFTLRYLDSVPSESILHLPQIAYSGPPTPPGFPDDDTAGHAAKALSRNLGVPVEIIPGHRHLKAIYRPPEPNPLVSIVIPTRDRADLLGRTLKTLVATTAYRHFEIIIVDNGSVEPATFALLDEMTALWPASRVVHDNGDFNFSRICNVGVAEARGELLLLLNNDMEIIEPGWLDEMVCLAMLPRTGIVGAKLLYPNRTVQHAGFILGLREGAGAHWFLHAAADAAGYMDRLIVRQNLSAVTGACLMIRRDCWEATGPLDDVRFAQDCNDIDLCLRARQAGFDVVFTPFALLLHHESASRGSNMAPGVLKYRRAEWERFEAIWHVSETVDPYYSPNLRRDNVYALRSTAPRAEVSPRTDMLVRPSSASRSR